MIKYFNIIQGDCLEVMKDIPSRSVDLIYTNPPFGITNAKWDKPLNWKDLWKEIWRIGKENVAVIIHASMPFNYDLVSTQRKYFKYEYVWIKNIATGFFNAKNAPLRKHEVVCVFYKKLPTYNPQMIGKEFHQKRLVTHGGIEGYWGKPKFEGKWGREIDEGGHYGRYPNSVLYFDTKKSSPHKEDAQTNSYEMIDFFIKTYSNENDTILDFCCYKGDRLIRAKELNRNFIGIDINDEYIDIAKKRISNIQVKLV